MNSCNSIQGRTFQYVTRCTSKIEGKFANMLSKLDMLIGGVVMVLSVPCVCVCLPIGIVLLYKWTRVRLAATLLLLSSIICCVFVHDLCAHFYGHTIWLAFNDIFLPEIFNEGRIGDRIVSMPLDSNKIGFELENSRRGTYAIGFWIPDGIGSFVPVKIDVRIACDFFDEAGKTVFRCVSSQRDGWRWREDFKRGGSHMLYLNYEVPRDLPLNRRIRAAVEFYGDVKEYQSTYPNAEFIIDKVSNFYGEIQ